YSVWKHIACNKLQLSEDLAWMYFEGYLLLSDMPSGQKVALYNQLAKCKTSADRDKWRAQLTVDTLKFVLLLYIQQLHKINLRTSMVLNEEWPSRSRSPELEGRSTPSSSKALDEHSHLTFVLNHLNELMELLIEPDAYGTAGSDVNLSMEAVEALSFIIAGSIDRSKAVTPIHELALTPQAVKAKSGFSKITGTFSFRMLQSWLRATLTTNPFGIGSCIATGRRLSWPMAAEDKESKGENLGKRGKIATNAHLVPREHIMGNKVIIMSQVCKQTISRSSGTLEMATVKVHRCHFAYLYLLSPIRSVSIEKCRNSTIILGAVDTVVHVNACEQVTVIGACRRFSV
ncbi:TBCC domain-containing protein 1-like, partial [Lingula anatina]